MGNLGPETPRLIHSHKASICYSQESNTFGEDFIVHAFNYSARPPLFQIISVRQFIKWKYWYRLKLLGMDMSYDCLLLWNRIVIGKMYEGKTL